MAQMIKKIRKRKLEREELYKQYGFKPLRFTFSDWLMDDRKYEIK